MAGISSSAWSMTPTNWNPAAAAWTPSEFEVGRAIYDRLAVYSDSHELLPELAQAPSSTTTTSPSGRSRCGPTSCSTTARRSTPRALKMNLEAQQLSPVAGPLLVPVKSIFVTGPLTVRISMRTPWSTFPHLLTSQAGFVASPATLSSADGRGAPVGTGPFVFNARCPGPDRRGRQELVVLARRAAPARCRVLPRDRRLGTRVPTPWSTGRVDMVLADDPVTIKDLRDASASGNDQPVARP